MTQQFETAPVSREAEPDTRPLGALAVGAALLSLLLSWTYFFSPFALLVATVGLPLGFMARGNEPTRTSGTAALVITTLAVVVAVLALLTNPIGAD